MSGAPADLEQVLSLVAGGAVLLDCIVNGLLGEVVLEFEGGDGQTVDEECQVEGTLFLVVAVPQLTGYGEPVLGVAGFGVGVSRRGSSVEQVDMVLSTVDSLVQDVDDSAASDLALEAC